MQFEGNFLTTKRAKSKRKKKARSPWCSLVLRVISLGINALFTLLLFSKNLFKKESRKRCKQEISEQTLASVQVHPPINCFQLKCFCKHNVVHSSAADQSQSRKCFCSGTNQKREIFRTKLSKPNPLEAANQKIPPGVRKKSTDLLES